MGEGWIKLHKKFLDWEWYDDHKTCRLFIHLLLKANYEDNEWRGILIKRGERATSLRNLAKETGLTLKQIRLSLDKLRGAQQTAQRTAHKGAQSFSIITICNYEEYQQVGAHEGAQRRAQRRAPIKEVKNKEKENIKRKFTPPTIAELDEYITEKGYAIDAEYFWHYYEARGWKLKNGPMKSWKSALVTFEKNNKRWADERNGIQQGATPEERDWHKLSESAFAAKYGEGDINRGNDIWLSTAKKLGKL